MIGFDEKIKRIEARKKEYRERLMALEPEEQEKVETRVWAHAAAVSQVIGPWERRKPAVLKVQEGLNRAFEQVRHFPVQEEVSPAFLMDLHWDMTKEDDPWNAGRYRRTVARWNNSTMIMSNWQSIPSLMDKLCQNMMSKQPMGFYHEDQKNQQLRKMAYHPLVRAMDAYYRTIVTHPFADANKRVGRAVMALMLRKEKYVPMAIYHKQQCVSAVEDYCATHQPYQFYRVMMKEMDETYDMAFHFLKCQELGRS